MEHSVVLMDARHQAAFPMPDAELVFFSAPFSCDKLAKIQQAHPWSPPGDKLEALPEILKEMRGLKSLSIGPGSIAPSIMDGLGNGLLPEGIVALSIHLGTGTLVWPSVVLPNLRTLYVDVPLRCGRCRSAMIAAKLAWSRYCSFNIVSSPLNRFIECGSSKQRSDRSWTLPESACKNCFIQRRPSSHMTLDGQRSAWGLPLRSSTWAPVQGSLSIRIQEEIAPWTLLQM